MGAPVTEIINTGTELLLGSILNSHQQWLCRELTNAGFLVSRQTAISDSAPAIQAALSESFTRADLIITTGGLGPTSDDRTRAVIADLLGRELVEDAAARENIERFFASRAKPVPPSTLVQALAPQGAMLLQNAHGTAPGLALRIQDASPARPNGVLLVMLPGPPRELHPMFRNQVIPLLRETFADLPPYACCVLRTTGLGESYLEEAIAPHLGDFIGRGLEIGYCARVGEVEVRLSSCGPAASVLVNEASAFFQNQLADYVFGMNDEVIEAALVHSLTARGETLALAESCTGGYIANKITNVPGASAVFLGGLVTYSNDAKTRFLNVRRETLAEHGAVSGAVAAEMALGARAATGATWAASVTGIAGPGGGTAEKPVGTVYIAIAGESGVTTHHRINRYDRETFKFTTAQQTLDFLRREVKGKEANSPKPLAS